jgi:hypothetical protein
MKQNEKIPTALYELHILKKAMEKWGTEKQILQCVEELTELSLELLHSRRNKTTEDKICSEIADVKIMIRQMELIFDMELIKKYTDIKLKRLECRIEDV